MRSSIIKLSLIAVISGLVLSSVSGQISQSFRGNDLVFENSTGDDILELGSAGNLNFSAASASEINNFFEENGCGSSEAVKQVYDNGSYECVAISEDKAAEGLPATLAVDNNINDTLSLSSGQAIEIGSSVSTDDDGDVAIGRNVDAAGGSNGYFETAVGYSADASGLDSSAFGVGSSATAEGAVAIGDNANAPNGFEATFGNLNGEELDVNVTGNLTVHGSGNFNSLIGDASGDKCGTNEFLNGDGDCKEVSVAAQETENLSETLAAGNTANVSIDMGGNNITDSVNGNVTVGQSLKVYGNLWGTGADLAEIYPSEQELRPGEVVGFAGNGAVERTSGIYQKTVGVVSEDPGYVMNTGEEGYRIALRGKVSVRISPYSDPVQTGDYIVSSSLNGMAMSCRMKDEMEAETFEELKQITKHNRLCRDNSVGQALEDGKPGTEVQVLIGG
jgi:hypothetical protein